MSHDVEPCCGDKKCDGAACGCAEGCSHPEHKAPERALTPDEARGAIAATMARVAQATVSQLEMEDDSALPLTERENKRLLLEAARELVVTLLRTARQFNRPRILRPSRSLRVL